MSGAIVACRKVKQACERYLRDLEASKSESYPWKFDPDKAARPVRFIEKFLAPTKGNYDRMELMPWQCFVECNLYGWTSKQTALRRFREGLIVVGTGNGKSTMVAGNATYAVSKDGEKGADIYLMANSKDQAKIVFDTSEAQIMNSPLLAGHFRTLRDGIHYDLTRGKIMARSSDSERLDGLNPHLAVFDEIHEFKTYKLINVIKSKSVKRKQPLALYITTMGYVLDGPLANYYALFSDALIPGKLRQTTADRLFAFIAELDDEDNVEDASKWIKANPSLGVLLDIDTLKEEWERCKLIPAERANFITKQLNVMVAADDMQFCPPEILKRNTDTIPEEALLGRPCYGGFDLSDREDFTAAALEFPLDDGRIAVMLHSWVPRRKVELDNEKIDYYGLAMRGSLDIVDGEYIRQEDVCEWFRKQAEKYELLAIGYDPANASTLSRMLGQGDKDHPGHRMVVVRQGPMTLNDPMKDIKERLIDGGIVHNNDPMFNWYTDNVRISAERRHTDKNNWMPQKRNRYRKIDGFMAFLDAHTVFMQENGSAAGDPGITVYEL
ncbi:MAG: terminase large subunit [Clostridiales bacterium]|nr:terminase large subunit [Clostridiales bacterium]